MTQTIICTQSYGFFADFITLLQGVRWVVEQGDTPYVRWANFRYQNTANVNLFDRYFHQVGNWMGGKIWQDLTPAGRFPYIFKGPGLSNEEYLAFFQPYVDVMKRLDMLASPYMLDFDASPVDGKVVGFHKRGTDRAEAGQPTTDDEWVGHITKAFNDGYEKALCITDQESSLRRFKSEFGDRIISTDSYRSPDDQPIHLYHIGEIPDRLKLADDVMRDAVMLSRCSYMMLSRSNVTLFALICAMHRENFGTNDFTFVDRHRVFWN